MEVKNVRGTARSLYMISPLLSARGVLAAVFVWMVEQSRVRLTFSNILDMGRRVMYRSRRR